MIHVYRNSVTTLIAPVFASLEITPFCNNQCPGCGNVGIIKQIRRGKKSPLSLENWVKIIRDLSPYIMRFRITGGEPTLSPYFLDIVSFINHQKIPFIVFSNGRSLKEDLIQTIKGYKFFNGFLISLHGHTAEVHGSFTGVSHSFEETIATLRLLRNEGVRFATNTVITKENIENLESIYHTARSLGAEKTVFTRFIGKNELSPNDPVYQNGLKRLCKLRKQYIKPVISFSCLPECAFEYSSLNCGSGLTYCAIDPWGAVRPCTHTNLQFGNLSEEKITDIWKKESARQWRERVSPRCLSCVRFSQCRGGCKVLQDAANPSLRAILKEEVKSIEISLDRTFNVTPQFGYRMEEGGAYALIHNNNVVVVDQKTMTAILTLLRQSRSIYVAGIERTYGKQFYELFLLLVNDGFLSIQYD